MKLKALLLLLGLSLTSLQAIDIKVRLYSNYNLDKAILTVDSTLFYLLALEDDQVLDTVLDIFPQEERRSFYLAAKGGELWVHKGSEALGRFSALRFHSTADQKQFRIEAKGRGRAYYGDIIFRAQGDELIIINEVELNHYVAGVVESEAGHVSELEFYKAQAVLARTFAVKSWRKHLSEGYNLKDDVTSQVYHSKSHYTNKALIDSAVEATLDTILVLESCEPVLTVFHANSGGYTMNSEDVWLKPIDYLKARQDSFSRQGASYRWEKRIPAEEFYGYFARKLGVANDANLRKALLNFDQSDRYSHFEYQSKRIKLTHVRRDFRLRSTFFSVEQRGSEILLRGRGFGHGVGLSQDGAIEMSRLGYSFREILHFYFTGVELESIDYCLREAS